MKRSSLIAVVAGLMLTVCAWGQTTALTDLTIVPEPGWTVRTHGLPAQAIVAIASPRADEGFYPNFNIVHSTLDRAMALDAFAEQNEREIRQAGATVVERGRVTVDGVPASRMVWRQTMQGHSLQFHTTCVLRGRSLYVLTGTAPRQSYARYAAAFDRMAASVRFRKEPATDGR
jgi:hypothetical protein